MCQEVLYAHYQDSFGRIREREKQRDRLFLIAVGLLGTMVLLLRYTVVLHAAIPELNIGPVTVKLTQVPLPVLLSTAWTFLAAIVLRYYQVTLDVEKKYDNLHRLEERLSEALGASGPVDRESSGYLTQKGKWFRYWVWVFYTAAFPTVILSVVIWAISREICGPSVPWSHRVYDSVLATFVATSVLLYLGAVWLANRDESETDSNR